MTDDDTRDPAPTSHPRSAGVTGRATKPRAKAGTPAKGGRPPAARKRTAGRTRRSRGCLAAVALALVVASGLALGVWSFLFAPTVTTSPGQPVQIVIEKGTGSSEIAERLANQGVIANPNMFRLKLRMSQESGTLKAGTYDLSTGLGYDEVMAQLREGPPIHYITVTIPEGFTVEQIAARVQEKTGVRTQDFLALAKTGAKEFDHPFLASNPTDSLEGYLFPKTYRVKVGSSARDIIDLMLRQFEKETTGLDLTYAAGQDLTLHDVVVIASMIEREASVAQDRPLVSSVIYNRLSKGMLLEIDATVQYVVGNKSRLLYSDLEVDSPYNTYRNRGLPPGPIACPGLASLQAAAAPAQTGYLFYVLTHKDGSHSFAATHAEFLKLKAEAKKGLK